MKTAVSALALCSPFALFAAPTLYATRYPWEVDSAVTAWVLKRHVAPEARFTAMPKDADFGSAQGIDVPASPYRRTGRHTAFDAALRLHAIDTDCTRRLTPLVRILELAKWQKSTMPEAEAFELALIPLLPDTPDGEMTAAFDYLDRFCREQGTKP